MTIASDNIFPKLIIAEGSAPASPSAGDFKLYVDSSDHLFKMKNSSGTVTTFGAGIADQGTATFFDFTTGAAPASPAAGKVRLYSLTGDHMYQKTSGGTATALDSAGGGGSLTTVVQEISADFTTASDSAWHDVTGMTGISVAAGTWLAFHDVEYAMNGSAGPTFRLTDGTTTYAQAETLLTNVGGAVGQHLFFASKPLVLGSTTTMKLQVFSDVVTTVKKYPQRGGDSTSIATKITFLQIA